MLGVGGIAAESVADHAVIPNDRVGMLGVGAIQREALQSASVRPDDRGGLRGPGAVAAGTIAAVVDDGFQWRDAAFGAGAALAIVFLGIVGALTLRQHRRVILR